MILRVTSARYRGADASIFSKLHYRAVTCEPSLGSHSTQRFASVGRRYKFGENQQVKMSHSRAPLTRFLPYSEWYDHANDEIANSTFIDDVKTSAPIRLKNPSPFPPSLIKCVLEFERYTLKLRTIALNDSLEVGVSRWCLRDKMKRWGRGDEEHTQGSGLQICLRLQRISRAMDNCHSDFDPLLVFREV